MGEFADELAFAPHSPQQSEVDAALRLFNPVSVTFHQVRTCDKYANTKHYSYYEYYYCTLYVCLFFFFSFFFYFAFACDHRMSHFMYLYRTSDRRTNQYEYRL